MKKYICVIACSLALGCASTKISEADKTTILNELDYIYTVDQKFAGLPPAELIEKYGNEEAWKIFLKQGDSVGVDNQNADALRNE